MTVYNGRPSPTRIHLRTSNVRRRTLCGRDNIPKVNSVHVSELDRRRVVSCRRCLAKAATEGQQAMQP